MQEAHCHAGMRENVQKDGNKRNTEAETVNLSQRRKISTY